MREQGVRSRSEGMGNEQGLGVFFVLLHPIFFMVCCQAASVNALFGNSLISVGLQL